MCENCGPTVKIEVPDIITIPDADVDDHICPECREGKHKNCLNIALCIVTDKFVDCTCNLYDHKLESVVR